MVKIDDYKQLRIAVSNVLLGRRVSDYKYLLWEIIEKHILTSKSEVLYDNIICVSSWSIAVMYTRNKHSKPLVLLLSLQKSTKRIV